MCGIFGVYSPHLTTRETALFQNLCLLNVYRGRDSTGMLRVNDTLQTNVLRATAPSIDVARHPYTENFLAQRERPSLLLGHCRAATIGAITPQNVHPFSFPNTIGVMNGTFRGAFTNWAKYDTDSEAIYANISELGLVKGLEESMVLDPQFALAYFDKPSHTVNFIKNDKRPLHFTFINNRKTLVWSSDAEVLEKLLPWMGFKFTGWDGGTKDRVFSLHEYDLLSVTVGEPATSAHIEHQVVKQKEVPKFTYPVRSAPYQGPAAYEGYADWFNGMDDDGPVSAEPLVKGLDGQYRTHKEENQLIDETFAKSRLGKKAYRRQSMLEMDPKEDAEGDLTTLGWLKKQANDNEETRFKKHAYGTTGADGVRPVSDNELRYKLKTGCFCCGNVIDLKDKESIAKLHWWSRDAYACDDCWNISDMNWVRDAIHNDWPLSVHTLH